MGMAASQVRFLSLQNRKNTIGLNLMTLSNRKTALSRDMNRVAAEYNAAMNEKVLKWSSDSGVTYRDLNYDLLMKPNDVNSTLPYIITDDQGRVVIDDSKIELENGDSKVTYRDLAMMISAYSGDDGNGKAQYNNLNNLTGGNLTSAAIGDATLTGNDKAVSGVANKDKEYEIVTNSVDMVSGTLRYELMEKLGLISEAEKNEIINLEKDIYGDTEKTTGPYPIGSLMGDYYLALAHLEAYKNLLIDGEYQFSTSTETPNNTITFEKYPYQGGTKGDPTIKYSDKVSGTGTEISFNGNGTSAAINNVLLDKKYDKATGTFTDNPVVNGNISAYMDYSIQNGKLEYTYKTPNLLSLMNTCDADLKIPSDGNSPVTVHKKNSSESVGNLNGMSWASLYENDYSIRLYQWDDEKRGNQSTEPLTAIITEMGTDLKAQTAVEIDEAAVTKAEQSTLAFFSGQITNGGQIIEKHYERTHSAGRVSDYVYDNTDDFNLIVGSNKNIWRFLGKEVSAGRSINAVNFRNLYDVFITFYDFYAHTPDVPAIVSGDPVSVPSQNAYEPIDTSDVRYVSTSEFTDGSITYQRKEGKITSGDGTEYTVYDYYKKGENILLQRDINVEGKFYREYYDHYNQGAGAKSWEMNPIEYTNYIKKVGQGTGTETPLETANESFGASNQELKLSYVDQFGNTVEYTLSNRRASSTYATTINANPVDITADLEKAVKDAETAKDDALDKLDKLFASKDSKIMDYFDALFKMIAQNGWVYDEHVNDTTQPEESKNYLNAKLENNMYFITEVDTLDGTDFNYATKLATNVSKVFQVFDRDAQNVALSEYEAEKAEITAKEKQVDVRMNKLEMEQDAIKTELDSLKKIINDNIDNTFKIFT